MPLDLFTKTAIPEALPFDMEITINEIKKSFNKKECLKKVYDLLTQKYHGNRFKTYTKLSRVFHQNLTKLWSKQGFLHCTSINYILRTLLIKSDFFKETEIRLRWTLVWYLSPHQYVQVLIDDKWLNIDIWAYRHGIEFGDYAHGFH